MCSTRGSIHASACREAFMSMSSMAISLPPSPLRRLIGRSGGHGGLMIGSAILAVIALMALLAPLIAPDDPYRQDLMSRTIPPICHATGTWEHALGTDSLGRAYPPRHMDGGGRRSHHPPR